MKKLMILIISLVWLAPLVFSDDYASDDQGSVEPQYYDNAKVLRVKYTQGEAYVKRSYDDEGFEEAAINLPIFEKDVAGTTDGRLEIYLGRLNYVRLDYDTEVVFEKVPELQKTDLSLKILRGGIYLDIENLDYERDIELQTADCGVFLLDKGLYRVNVSEGGRTEVYVYDGVAEVAGNNFSRNVRENQKVVMFNGEVKERPFYFYSTEKDDFDLWNRERNNIIGYDRYSSSRYLDSGYEEYEYELSRHGSWKYHSTYNNYIWIPYSVDDDWRPYYHGRWVWNPYYGYVWMSFDSWGYFTHHYGRWHWDPIYHWHWLPAYHWSPAWVSWFWDDYYYGWCPLSWWNRPVIVIDGHWWRNHHYRDGIPIHARSTTIIRKSELSAAGIHHAALKKDSLRQISNKSIMFRGNAPDTKPVISKVNVINAKGNAVVYKQNGIVSTNKFKTDQLGTGISTVKGDKSVVYKYSGKELSKEKISKYSNSPYSSGTTFTPKKYKYGSSDKSSGSEKIPKSSGYKSSSTYKPKDESGSGSSSSSSSSGTSTIKRSPTKSSTSKGSSSSSSGSGSKPKIKKKDSEPSYSYSPSDSSSSYSYSSPYSGKKYTSKYRSSYSYSSPQRSERSYKSDGNSNFSDSSSSSDSSPSYSYRSSYKSSYKRPTSSYNSSSSSSSSSYSYKSYREPTSSYNSTSTPSSSSRSSYSPESYTPSSSYTPSHKSYSTRSSSYTPSRRSYSTPSSSYTPAPKSYSVPSTSHRSSSGSSSSFKSSSGSSFSHRSSSSGSSSSSFKKKQ